jgi:hypothetical protein
LLLETETDPTKKAVLTRLLAEEEAKQVAKAGKKGGLGFALAVRGPFPPMRRLDVDAFLRRRINPFGSELATGKYQCVDSTIIHHADLKVGIGWRNRNGQPFFGQRMNALHFQNINS